MRRLEEPQLQRGRSLYLPMPSSVVFAQTVSRQTFLPRYDSRQAIVYVIRRELY